MKCYQCAALLLALSLASVAETADLEKLNDTISRAADMETTVSDDGVVRLGWSRDDVAVEVDGMRLSPAAGLTSWAAFKPEGDGVVVMGDTVVFGDEITPAMDVALSQGLEVTALHKHFVFDEPPAYFMHIGGSGEPAKLAQAIKATWDAIKQQRQRYTQPQRRFPGEPPELSGEFKLERLESLLGGQATLKDGVAKFTFAREGKMHGVSVGGSMGLATWAAFSGNQNRAAVDGDFIMTADEVQPVIRALRARDIHVVALHNHMIGETPAFYFLHYWGKGRAADLAAGIKAALEVQQPAKTQPATN